MSCNAQVQMKRKQREKQKHCPKCLTNLSSPVAPLDPCQLEQSFHQYVTHQAPQQQIELVWFLALCLEFHLPNDQFEWECAGKQHLPRQVEMRSESRRGEKKDEQTLVFRFAAHCIIFSFYIRNFLRTSHQRSFILPLFLREPSRFRTQVFL